MRRLASRAVLWLLITVIAMALAGPLGAAEETVQPAPSWQVYFSPNGGCTRAIVNAIAAARKEILVQAYEITSSPIKAALLAAHRRGVPVSVIVDPDALKAKYSIVGALIAGGIPVYLDSAHAPGLAHNKVMVIDQATVITGSFNFTRAAEKRNAENLLVIHDRALAAQYAHNFTTHLAHSSPLRAAELPAAKPTYHYHHYRHYYRHHHYHRYFDYW